MIMKMRDMLKRKNGQKGFTLVELIVVMAILAILAAIAVPKYTGVQNDAKLKAHNANVAIIKNAVALYAAQNNVAESSVDTTKAKTIVTEWPANPLPAGTKVGDTDISVAYTVTGGVVAPAAAPDKSTVTFP